MNLLERLFKLNRVTEEVPQRPPLWETYNAISRAEVPDLVARVRQAAQERFSQGYPGNVAYEILVLERVLPELGQLNPDELSRIDLYAKLEQIIREQVSAVVPYRHSSSVHYVDSILSFIGRSMPKRNLKTALTRLSEQTVEGIVSAELSREETYSRKRKQLETKLSWQKQKILEVAKGTQFYTRIGNLAVSEESMLLNYDSQNKPLFTAERILMLREYQCFLAWAQAYPGVAKKYRHDWTWGHDNAMRQAIAKGKSLGRVTINAAIEHPDHFVVEAVEKYTGLTQPQQQMLEQRRLYEATAREMM